MSVDLWIHSLLITCASMVAFQLGRRIVVLNTWISCATAAACRAQDVVGIITRHDLLPETIEDRFEEGGGQYAFDG